jgi:hypothetical protein
MWLLILPILAAVYVYSKTNKSPKEYTSTMTLYTGLTSGVSIASEQSNVDYSQALIAYDNLINVMKSQKTLEGVGLRLFCGAMMFGEKDAKYITKQYYDYLIKSVPPDVLKLINKKSEQDTYTKCKAYMGKDEDNFIYNLIYKSGTNFSIGSLSNISIRRISTSDLVEVSYKANDPGMCYRSLLILYGETKLNFQALKTEQSDDVVKYFEQEMGVLKTSLGGLEDNLVNYSKENKIINYDEQSKLIVSQKFGLDDKMDNLSMMAEGANKSIAELEKKMGIQNRLRLKSDQIVSIRNQIAKLSAEKAASSFSSIDTSKVSPVFDRRIDLLRGQFRAALDSMHLIQNTDEGVTIENILSQWLNNVIAYDQAIAQMPIIDKRAKLINELFDQYSPLGANVKRQEREIGVTEQQYLTVLAGLHSARLKDQSAKMSAGSISLLDPPTYPFSFLPNKSSLRGIIGFLAVFLLILVIIIIIEFSDRTMSNVERAERFSKLQVGLLFPLISSKKKKERIDNMDEVASNFLAVELLRIIKIGTEPVQINLLSLYSQEGKSFIKERLESAFQRLDDQNNTKLRELVVLKEFPALSDQYIDKNDISEGSVTIIFARANRAWKTVDTRIVELLTKQIGAKPIMLLNGVAVEVLESQWANLPVKRSKIRMFLHKVLTLEFTSKNKFS